MDYYIEAKDQRIQAFLEDIGEIDAETTEILQHLRKIIIELFPNVDEQIKYGGIVYLIDDLLFCGFFVRKHHISIEFTEGFKLEDPNKLLEGKGQYRRHLKIKAASDIKEKKVDFFIQCSGELGI